MQTQKRYLRFHSRIRSAELTTPTGVFYAVAQLVESNRLDPWTIERIDDICAWFNRHLPVPRLRGDERRAVFWFRAECHDMIQRLWELVDLLQEDGTVVDMVHTTRPGWVRYADDFQVAAIPTRR